MSETKHTPGPWEWKDGEYDDDLMFLASASGTICTFGNCDYYERCGELPNEADCRLIAAAPELLEALKRCLEIMSNGGTWTLEDQNAAHAAIAKAEGGEP